MHKIASNLDERDFRFQAQLLESVLDAVVVTDLDFNILSWNKAAESLYGWSIEEVIGKPMGEVIPTNYIEENGEAVIAAFQAEGGWQGEVIQRGKDSSEIYVLALVTLIRDENGIPSSVLAINRDITSRRQTENTLRESEERYRATFEQAAVGIAHVAPDGRFLHLNQRFCDIVGYSQDEMLASTFQDITHPDDLDKDLEIVRKLLQGEAKVYSIEKRYFRKNGEIIWVNLTVSLLRDKIGEPKWFVSIIEDITKQKQLREERDRILDSSQDLICVAGMDGYFKYLNPTWEPITGYTREELLARPFLEFTHPEDHAMNSDELAQLASGRQTVDFQNRYICKDGSIRTFSWTATPLLEDQVMYCIGRDITERKQAERALKESEEKFRALVTNTEEIVYLIARDGTFLLSEGKGLSKLGLKPGQVVGESVFELYEDYPEMFDAIRKTFNGQTTTLDLKVGDQYFKNSYTPHIDNEGKIIGLLGLSVNTTEQKLGEKAINDYQQRLKALAAELTLAEERERRRIAADLHDHVSQTLALARVQLVNARKTVPGASQDALFDEVSQTLIEAIQATRTLTFDLSSPLLKELGLEMAVSAWLRDQIGIGYNLETKFLDDGQEKPLTEDVRAILFRNVRELLANVVRHAQATEIQVSVERLGSDIIITVQDDGLGFDPSSVFRQDHPKGGFGLFSIQERMADMGGSFEIISAPGEGCTAVLSAPLDLGNHSFRK
jgi:PAS domain S-box-containing protein